MKCLLPWIRLLINFPLLQMFWKLFCHKVKVGNTDTSNYKFLFSESLILKCSHPRFSNITLPFFFITLTFHFALREYQVDDVKLGMIDRPDGCAPIQRDFSRLETWTNGNLLKYTQEKLVEGGSPTPPPWWHYLWGNVSSSGISSLRERELLKRMRWRTTKMRTLEHLFCEEKVFMFREQDLRSGWVN